MRAIAWLLRVFCYLFHLVLSLVLLALGFVAISSGATNMKIETLPWTGSSLNQWLILLGVAGLLSVILAVAGWLRFLLPLWALFTLGMLLRGVFLSPAVSFSGQEDFHNWLLLIAAAAIALIGSLTLFRRRRV